MTREELLALTPEIYLARGYRSPDGLAWPELQTLWPLAAAEQLKAAGVSPAQFESALAAALKKLLAPGALTQDGQGALVKAANLPETPRPLREQLKTFALCIQAPADVPVAAQHLGAILRVLALKKALDKPAGSP